MLNLGILLAAISAVVYGFRNVAQKESVLDTNPYVSAWSKRAFTLLATTPVLLYYGIPKINFNKFVLAFAISTVVNLVASVTIAKAYNREEVSFLAPLGALSPVPVLITAPLILNEWPSLYGYLGVFLIVSGTYLLKFEEPDLIQEQLKEAVVERSAASAWAAVKTVLRPLKRVVVNPAAQLVFFTILIHSISAVYDKVGVLSSSPVFWTTAISAGSAIGLTPLMLFKTESTASTITQNSRPLLFLGILTGVGSMLQMAALEHTLVVYMSAIKRFSIPISVIIGFLLYNETNFRGRILGTVLVTAGGILIAVS